jgi:hypothetical protein
MEKSTRFSFVAVIVVTILLFIGNLAVPVHADNIEITTPTPTGTPVHETSNQNKSASPVQQEGIKSVIRAYFEIRYRALSVSQPDTFQLKGFGDLVSDQPDTKAFLDAELGKLAVDIKHARLNHLRYADLKYSLDFKNIAVDASSLTATVSVTEGNEVVYEFSKEHDPLDPIVTRMSGLDHTIILRQEQGKWKITSDYYNDYLWRMLRETGKSADEILRTMKALPESSLQSASTQTQVQCTNLPSGPTHAYDRTGAVNYANAHANNYNPDYPDYDDGSHGDCTNFVSQSIYEGGNASMTIPDPLPSPSGNGQLGWYLLNETQRATDWNDVSGFYDFVTHPYVWDEGPEGCDVTIGDLMPGDVIQYGDGTTWYHAVIVVEIRDGIPYVASHSPNISPVAYNRFDYFGNYSDIRFIRIEQSKGNPPVKAKIDQGSDDAGTNPTPCTFSATDNEVYLGTCFSGGNITSGFRFTNVQIPKRAHIKYAYLIFTVDGDYTVPISVNLFGEATGNSLTFTASDPPETRPTTNHSVLWNITDNWILGMRRTPPDLSSVIQDIVRDKDWSSGNALSVITENANSTTHRRVIGFERATWDTGDSPAKLIITYSLK